MKLVLIAVAAVALTSCARAPVNPRDDAFDQHLAWLGAQMESGQITRKQAAVSAREKAKALFRDPYMDELWSYRIYLSDEVERKAMTVEQASYLDDKKVNEIIERLKIASAQDRSNRPTFFRPTTTCRPDGYGGVRCQ